MGNAYTVPPMVEEKEDGIASSGEECAGTGDTSPADEADQSAKTNVDEPSDQFTKEHPYTGPDSEEIRFRCGEALRYFLLLKADGHDKRLADLQTFLKELPSIWKVACGDKDAFLRAVNARFKLITGIDVPDMPALKSFVEQTGQLAAAGADIFQTFVEVGMCATETRGGMARGNEGSSHFADFRNAEHDLLLSLLHAAVKEEARALFRVIFDLRLVCPALLWHYEGVTDELYEELTGGSREKNLLAMNDEEWLNENRLYVLILLAVLVHLGAVIIMLTTIGSQSSRALTGSSFLQRGIDRKRTFQLLMRPEEEEVLPWLADVPVTVAVHTALYSYMSDFIKTMDSVSDEASTATLLKLENTRILHVNERVARKLQLLLFRGLGRNQKAVMEQIAEWQESSVQLQSLLGYHFKLNDRLRRDALATDERIRQQVGRSTLTDQAFRSLAMQSYWRRASKIQKRSGDKEDPLLLDMIDAGAAEDSCAGACAAMGEGGGGGGGAGTQIAAASSYSKLAHALRNLASSVTARLINFKPSLSLVSLQDMPSEDGVMTGHHLNFVELQQFIRSGALSTAGSFNCKEVDTNWASEAHEQRVMYASVSQDTYLEVLKAGSDGKGEGFDGAATRLSVPIAVMNPHLGLVDVLENCDLFEYSDLDASEKTIPLLFQNNCKTSGQAVVNGETFVRQFFVFTEGQLAGLNWANVVAAGGAVLAAVTPAPPGGEQEYYNSPKYKDSDVDLFIYGLDRKGASAKAAAIVAAVRKGAPESYVKKTLYTLTIYSKRRKIQIVLRLYKSVPEVLHGFDIDVCTVAFDGLTVWATNRACRAICKQYNLVDLSYQSPSYESRLWKYSKRGYSVACPGLDMARVKPALLKPAHDYEMRSLQGLAKLVAWDAKFRADQGTLQDGRLPVEHIVERMRPDEVEVGHDRDYKGLFPPFVSKLSSKSSNYGAQAVEDTSDYKSLFPPGLEDTSDYKSLFPLFGPQWSDQASSDRAGAVEDSDHMPKWSSKSSSHGGETVGLDDSYKSLFSPGLEDSDDKSLFHPRVPKQSSTASSYEAEAVGLGDSDYKSLFPLFGPQWSSMSGSYGAKAVGRVDSDYKSLCPLFGPKWSKAGAHTHGRDNAASSSSFNKRSEEEVMSTTTSMGEKAYVSCHSGYQQEIVCTELTAKLDEMWLTENPGQQGHGKVLIGSFRPTRSKDPVKDWEKGCYTTS